MEKDIKQKLIDFLDVIREHPSIQIGAPTQVVVDWYEKEINCLEAKPKALHSMKEGENSVCDECDGYGWIPDENGRRKDSCSKCK